MSLSCYAAACTIRYFMWRVYIKIDLFQTFDLAMKFSFNEFHTWYQFALSLICAEKVCIICIYIDIYNIIKLLETYVSFGSYYTVVIFKSQYNRAYCVLKQCVRLQPDNPTPLLHISQLCYEHLHQVTRNFIFFPLFCNGTILIG